jgi:glycyl-tRNA synthetase
MPEKAQEILHILQPYYYCQYDEKDTIGRRYRRQDAIGTPLCVTIDQNTLTNNRVTVRHRDSMKQDEVSADKLIDYLNEHISIQPILTKLTHGDF